MNASNLAPADFEVRRFLDDQMNLDIMTYFAEGLHIGQIAEKIGENSTFVQSSIDFLRSHRMMTTSTRWNIDVNALGMMKTVEFSKYSEKELGKILDRNIFLSYLSKIEVGLPRYLAMYTFPSEVEEKIGSEITSWYYIFPHFTPPFFKKGQFERKIESLFEEENNEDPLPPRGERIENPDIIDILICRHIQLELEDINLRRYTESMKEEIGNLIDVNFDTVQSRFQRLKDKNVIYPISPFDFRELAYVEVFFITIYDEIFRFLKALNKINIIAAISFMKDGKKILYVQIPQNRKDAIANILSSLDRESQMFTVTEVYMNRGLPYKYYLKKLGK